MRNVAFNPKPFFCTMEQGGLSLPGLELQGDRDALFLAHGLLRGLELRV